jgi:2-desacetyl-2-hydroxyethyl bacteriochlorophyllide A dehydrogenase
MNTTARRIVWPERGRVALEEFSIGPPGPDEVLIETEYTVISPGTELAFLEGRENTIQRFPQWPGYSGVGRVLAVGPGIEGLSPGERVIMDHCGHASHALCSIEGWRGQGITAIGRRAIAAREAAFVPLASMALQGLRKTRPELGESLAIVGLGLLGLFATRLARLSGAFPILALDFDETRRELARGLGADASVAPDDPNLASQVREMTGGAGFDIILEVSGAASALPQALPWLAYRGRISLVGCSRGLSEGINFYRDIHKKGAIIIGAHNYVRPERESCPGYWTSRDDFRVLLDLMAEGRLDAKPLISEVVPPERAPEMYRRLHARESGLVGVIFRWATEGE